MDRYCISEDGDEKAHEIARMNEIYEDAEAVVINTVEQGPALGLAGVGRIRKPPARVRVGNRTLVSAGKHPAKSIHSST